MAETAKGRKGKSGTTPSMEEVMDELQSRFLVNLPASELTSSERLFFQIEQCYWFYEDFYADQFRHLQHLNLSDFARRMFGHCPLLQPQAHRCERMFQDFKVYQSQVPVVGCMLLNPACTKVLLVRNWKGTSWSFPRGKVNQGESDMECARREVLEECGYDVGDTLSTKAFVELVQNEQRMRMYVAKNVPEDYQFAPQTRKEISLIQWFEFDSLPKKTWSVLPFMPRLRRWINRDKSGRDKGGNTATKTSGRAASAPRNRPVLVVNSSQTIAVSDRSVSTPHGRPVARKGRGHFGTEFDTESSHDRVNDQTFGASLGQFSVEEMFSINEKLTGQKFVYDGNPHDFGKPAQRSRSLGGVDSVGMMPPSCATPQVSGRLEVTQVVGTANPATKEDQETQPTVPVFKFDAVDIMAVVT